MRNKYPGYPQSRRCWGVPLGKQYVSYVLEVHVGEPSVARPQNGHPPRVPGAKHSLGGEIPILRLRFLPLG